MSVKIRTRITGREIDETQFRIYRRGLPNRCSATRPCLRVLRPGIVTKFTRSRNGVEGPDEFSVFRIVSFDAAAGSSFCAGKADYNEAIVVQGSSRNRVTILRVLRLNGPCRITGFLIECHQLSI